MFKCYSAKLANMLVMSGIEMKGQEINYKKPQYLVYIFEDTPKVRELFDKYCKEQN